MSDKLNELIDDLVQDARDLEAEQLMGGGPTYVSTFRDAFHHSRAALEDYVTAIEALLAQAQRELADEKADHKETYEAMLSAASDIQGLQAELAETQRENEQLKQDVHQARIWKEGYRAEAETLERPTYCHWSDQDEYWHTECGNDFVLEADTPKENGIDYCPYCGRHVVEQKEVARP